VADPVELAELFDVDVDHLAGALAFISMGRLGRLQSAQPRACKACCRSCSLILVITVTFLV
jgi:hypothetical protein